MEQAKAIGHSLIDDSKPEESQKVIGRLEALTTQFKRLESVAQTRMTRLEAALKCATAYEDEGSNFNEWLTDVESKLESLEQLAIVSQPLQRQLEEIKVLCVCACAVLCALANCCCKNEFDCRYWLIGSYLAIPSDKDPRVY